MLWWQVHAMVHACHGACMLWRMPCHATMHAMPLSMMLFSTYIHLLIPPTPSLLPLIPINTHALPTPPEVLESGPYPVVSSMQTLLGIGVVILLASGTTSALTYSKLGARLLDYPDASKCASMLDCLHDSV